MKKITILLFVVCMTVPVSLKANTNWMTSSEDAKIMYDALLDSDNNHSYLKKADYLLKKN